MAARFRLRATVAGDEILSKGKSGRSVLLLSRGHARVVDENDQRVESFAAGRRDPIHVMIGEIAFLRPGPRLGTVIAGTDCEMLEIPCRAAPALVEASPILAVQLHMEILRAVCYKLTETTSARAHYEAVLGGDWEQWFVPQDYYIGRGMSPDDPEQREPSGPRKKWRALGRWRHPTGLDRSGGKRP